MTVFDQKGYEAYQIFHGDESESFVGAARATKKHIRRQIRSCNLTQLGYALHAGEDMYSPGHGFSPLERIEWSSPFSIMHGVKHMWDETFFPGTIEFSLKQDLKIIQEFQRLHGRGKPACP